MTDHRSSEPDLEDLLSDLKNIPERNPHRAAEGRARFLAQGRVFAASVSQQANQRHRGCNKNLFERISKTMKLSIKSFALLTAAILIGVMVFMTTRVTTVSAQQILQRASDAQTKAEAISGIQHDRMEIYQNPESLEGDHVGATTVMEIYYNPTTGYSRSIICDSAGNILQAFANDGSFSYLSQQPTGSGGLIINRTPLDQVDAQRKKVYSSDEQTETIFDQFYNNPRVELESEKIWTDGSTVYVLVNRSYQTQKSTNGQEEKILTGTTRMVFNKETYKLLQVETTVHKDDKDILIYKVTFLANETLVPNSTIAWDLSDLKGVTYVDIPLIAASEPKIETISQQELAAQTRAYVLKTIPEGFTLEIIAISDPAESAQPTSYEINYRDAENKSISMQAVGTLDNNFVEENFYDGSYKTASGLVLYFSPSSKENSTSAMLVDSDGNSFLLFADMSRQQVQTLAEELVPAQ